MSAWDRPPDDDATSRTTQAATPPPPTVSDRRPQPAGAMPRALQLWVMLALALGLLGVVLFTGSQTSTPTINPGGSGSASAPPAADVNQLQMYTARMKELEGQVRQQLAAQEAAAQQQLSAQPNVAIPPMAAVPTTDSIGEERRRRAFESLYSSNIVASRRPADQQPLGGDTGGLLRGATRGAAPSGVGIQDPTAFGQPPSVDAVAAAVVRAAQQQGALSATQPSIPRTEAEAIIGPLSESGPRGQGGAAVSRSATPAITATERPQRLLEGTIIDGILTNRLTGSLAGPVNVLVSNPVYSHSGAHVLIPAGSRVHGSTRPVTTWGEQRLAVAFHRLELPNGATVPLDTFTGLNGIGETGLRDRVNNHYLSTFGAAGAVGLITGLAQAVTNRGFGLGGGNNNTVIIAGAGADATAQAVSQIMNRYTNQLPTITIREGHRVKVYVTTDLELPPYEIPQRLTAAFRR